jgi:preprotein translocase subunit SecD
MLHFSRMKAAAILLTAFVVCCFNIPNFFPEAAVKNWPAFAQRRLTLAPELQGGSSVLLEVDRNDVRAFLIESMRRGVRDALQDAHMHWAKAPRIRGNGVEVTLREADVQGGVCQTTRASI